MGIFYFQNWVQRMAIPVKSNRTDWLTHWLLRWRSWWPSAVAQDTCPPCTCVGRSTRDHDTQEFIQISLGEVDVGVGV